jgi:crooked neck
MKENSKTAVKNRAPAPIQITAEQILREAQERGFEAAAKAPKQFVTDKEELLLYQQTKRKDFEDQLQRQRSNIGVWCKYALWEASQLEFERARSVFERVLDVEYRNQTIWLKYAEMEMKNKFINHARNVWDRAVTLLPRIDSFWYKYSYMEEMVGAVDNARNIFERWMSWEPDDLAWAAFIKFEVRQGQMGKAQELYERYIKLWPTSRSFLKYARWEEERREFGLARQVYERSFNELHPQEKTDKLLLNFARFEERCKEFERARVIYQYAIKFFSESDQHHNAAELKKEYVLFEKRHGNKEDIEDALVSHKREQFENLLASNFYNYDLWFDYIKLEEEEGKKDEKIAHLFERAIQYVPLVKEKKYWKRYIYLWIFYAAHEELTMKNPENARKIYQRCLSIIPHKLFTFGKIWLMAAELEIRGKDLSAARKLLGQAIGSCGKNNIFKGYIALELQLGEIDRCRTIYMKYISSAPYNCSAWLAYAQLEINLGEAARARSLFELAIEQPELDMPEILWKSFIDFEVSENEIRNARSLYERLLSRSSHVKVLFIHTFFSQNYFGFSETQVWISYASFEYEQAKNPENKGEDPFLALNSVEMSRSIFDRGYLFGLEIFFVF